MAEYQHQPHLDSIETNLIALVDSTSALRRGFTTIASSLAEHTLLLQEILNLLPPLTNQEQSHEVPEGLLDSTEIRTLGVIVDAEVFDEMLQPTSEETWTLKITETEDTVDDLICLNLYALDSQEQLTNHSRDLIDEYTLPVALKDFDSGGRYVSRALLIGFKFGIGYAHRVLRTVGKYFHIDSQVEVGVDDLFLTHAFVQTKTFDPGISLVNEKLMLDCRFLVFADLHAIKLWPFAINFGMFVTDISYDQKLAAFFWTTIFALVPLVVIEVAIVFNRTLHEAPIVWSVQFVGFKCLHRFYALVDFFSVKLISSPQSIEVIFADVFDLLLPHLADVCPGSIRDLLSWYFTDFGDNAPWTTTDKVIDLRIRQLIEYGCKAMRWLFASKILVKLMLQHAPFVMKQWLIPWDWCYFPDPSYILGPEKIDRSRADGHWRRTSVVPKILQPADYNLEGLHSTSNVSLMEIEAHTKGQAHTRCAAGIKTRLKGVSHGLTTSKELVKVLSHIWGLQEQHSWGMSLVSALGVELEQARHQVNQLLKEPISKHDEIDHLIKHFEAEKAAWKNTERNRVQSAIARIAEELEVETKLRMQTERLNKKLGPELAEKKKASLSKALTELESEKRAKEILEQVCAELAKGIGEDRAEVEKLKRESAKVREEMETEREMLQLADVLREERVQMKPFEAKYHFEEKNAAVERLSNELENYIRERLDRKMEGSSPDHERIKELEAYLEDIQFGSWKNLETDENAEEALALEIGATLLTSTLRTRLS